MKCSGGIAWAAPGTSKMDRAARAHAARSLILILSVVASRRAHIAPELALDLRYLRYAIAVAEPGPGLRFWENASYATRPSERANRVRQRIIWHWRGVIMWESWLSDLCHPWQAAF